MFINEDANDKENVCNSEDVNDYDNIMRYYKTNHLIHPRRDLK